MDGAYRPGVGEDQKLPPLHLPELASSPQGHISIKRNCSTFRKKSHQPRQGQAFISAGGEKQPRSRQGEPRVYASALPICRVVTSQPANWELWNPTEVAGRGKGHRGQCLMRLGVRRVGPRSGCRCLTGQLQPFHEGREGPCLGPLQD